MSAYELAVMWLLLAELQLSGTAVKSIRDYKRHGKRVASRVKWWPGDRKCAVEAAVRLLKLRCK